MIHFFVHRQRNEKIDTLYTIRDIDLAVMPRPVVFMPG